MNGWVKHFLDGTTVRGDDGDNQASWSRSRFSGLNATTIHHDGVHLCISGEGEYWQSDDYESVVMQDGPGEIVARRICFKITSLHTCIRVLQTEHSTMLKVLNAFQVSELMVADRIESIPPERIGGWLVLEYDVKDDTVDWYYSGDKI